MLNKKLFLSAASGEFGSHRRLLAGDLKRPTLDVAVQEDFGVTGFSTLGKLDDYIKACDAVIHLIGNESGSVPESPAVEELLARYPDLTAVPGASYTEWEAYLALYHHRPLFIYRPVDFKTSPHYERICALGHDRGTFLNEERLSSAVLRDLVEILPRLESRLDILPTKLRHTAEVLIGRDDELTMLDAAWNDAHKNVVVVRGKGGEGKTSLVASWMAELAMKDWRGAEFVYDWSFYSQGTRDQSTATAEPFIAAALVHFRDPDPNLGGPEERGARLARLVSEKRGLLVLDGLEPLQYPPGPMHGMLRDPGMAALVRGLAARNPGLCVVTTREKVDEIKQYYGKTAIDHELEFLSPIAGAALLHYAGARRAGAVWIARDDKELQEASEEVRGHALTLFLIGQYLRLTEDGDIRRRDRMKLVDAEAEYRNDATRPYGHSFKAIEAYERWFEVGDAQAHRQLAILRLLGLFDRPASKGCLDALRSEPMIAGFSEKDWSIALARLQEINLVSVKEDGAVDCHPLMREYFAAQLRTNYFDAWRSGHERIYEFLCASAHEGEEPTLEALQPLYQAITHGCLAGLQQKAFSNVYYDRIMKRDRLYSARKIGAHGSNLGAVACFFESLWSTVSPVFEKPDQAWHLNEAAYCLRALGRLSEALEPMRACGEMYIQQNLWLHASISYGNLSELELVLGEVDSAVLDAKQCVIYADRSGDKFQRIGKRATHADALHHAGRRDEAEALFREAEQMQADVQPTRPLLYSLRGFRYCEVLLAAAERAAWHPTHETVQAEKLAESCDTTLQRAAQLLEWARHYRDAPVLDAALSCLILGRASLYMAILSTAFLYKLSDPHSYLSEAVSHLRLAGYQDDLPRGLLTRAWCFAAEHLQDEAISDLDEAWDIASRGPMPLFLADIHLYRARLFATATPYPWESMEHDMAEARRLIEKHGYWRRKEELEDAEAALLGKPSS